MMSRTNDEYHEV